MANAIDPYSYGMGWEHGLEHNREIALDYAHSLAILEDSFRQVEQGRKSTVELYFKAREVFNDGRYRANS